MLVGGSLIPVGACEKETQDELKCHFNSIFKKSVEISLRWLAPSLDDIMLKSRYVNNQVLGIEKKDRWRSGKCWFSSSSERFSLVSLVFLPSHKK